MFAVISRILCNTCFSFIFSNYNALLIELNIYTAVSELVITGMILSSVKSHTYFGWVLQAFLRFV